MNILDLKLFLCLLFICYVIYNILLKMNRIDIIINICSILTLIIILSHHLIDYTNEIIYIVDEKGIIREMKNISKKKIK